MRKQTVVFVGILTLIAVGIRGLAFEKSPVVYAAPQLQETSTPRPTPTNESQPTNTPEPGPTNTPEEGPTNTPEEGPTNTPVPPTNTSEPPTNTPVPPTEEPKPTSKPKKRRKSSGSSDPTPVPPPPPTPTVAVLDSIPSTGFGVGGWTLGITGLVLTCILVVARRLRLGKKGRTERSDLYGGPGKHRHP
jgi:outer membrane biosynthesis protein TonB